MKLSPLAMRVISVWTSAQTPRQSRPGRRHGLGQTRAFDKANQADAVIDQAEKPKTGTRAKVKHPFRVIKRQFGFIKTRYKGIKINATLLVRLFALSNLWMVRGQLLCAPQQGAKG